MVQSGGLIGLLGLSYLFDSSKMKESAKKNLLPLIKKFTYAVS